MRLQTLRPKRTAVFASAVTAMLAVAVVISATAGEPGISATAGDHGAGDSPRQGSPPKFFPYVAPTASHPAVPTSSAPAARTVLPVVVPTTPPIVLLSKRAPADTPNSTIFRSTPGTYRSTRTPASARPSAHPAVNLRTAGRFAVLTKTGVTDVFASRITGDVGASPITGLAIGLTCAEVTGTIYTANLAGPGGCRVADAPLLTRAVSDQEAAYNDAAGRKNPDYVNLGAGQIGGRTLSPGVYSWASGLSITNDITLSGGPNDVFIFQIAGALNQAPAKRVILTGGAQARNVFWQTAGAVTIGTTAHSEGTILSKTMIALNTGASANGRLLAQTQVTLQKNVITNVP
ncbi:MAG TPA: ice-binding family protein [Dermatophilaceae bacterium]|nr:ice-binding family protein [Dermatophilaceae bacterium]